MATEKEPNGPEWFTLEQMEARYGITRIQARNRLAVINAQGKLEQWKGVSSKSRRTICKYRLV